MSNDEHDDNILEVSDIKKYFPASNNRLFQPKSYVRAVDGVSFSVRRGETLGLVGESGCGKSTVARTILRLIAADSGRIIFNGINILDMNEHEFRKTRKEMQMVFQKPFESLNPRMRVQEIVEEPFIIHKELPAKERTERVKELIELVGLNPQQLNKFPHELSGGQRQRVGIARAIALNPKMVICDEAVSALDVSIQAQILKLLIQLQQQFHLTYIFISHNLSVVKYISDTIVVMYLGKVMETAAKDALYEHPLHPYTQALLSAIPEPDIDIKKPKILLEGELPSPINPPKGCRFCTRCPKAMSICREQEPPVFENSPGHTVSCFLYQKN